MTTRPFLRPALLVALLVVAACGPDPTPEQRLQKLRLSHEIFPIGVNTVIGPSGEPTLLVDLQITNQGVEPLHHLTVMVRVRGPQGEERVAQRVTLDLSRVRPGVGVQMGATLPGVAASEEDEVTVEIESNLDDATLRSLPEWSDVAPG